MARSKTGYGTRKDGANWVWITWPDSYVHKYDVRKCLDEVATIPGCRVWPGGVHICKTSIRTRSVERLYAACGLPMPTFETRDITWVDTQLDRPLYPHQIEAVKHFLKNGGRGLLADVPGLGKTAMGITFAQNIREYYDYARPAVILAKKYLRQTWMRELAACGMDTTTGFCTLESRDIDDPSFRPDASWYFVNPEIVRDWWPKLVQTRPCVTIMDEAHHYKSLNSNRAKGALMLAAAPHTILLTGTPMPDRPQDLHALMTLVTGSGSWGTPNDFIQRYAGAEYNGYGYTPTTPTNEDELKERIAPWYLRRTLESAGIELPSFSRTVIEASWSDVKRGASEAKKHATAFRKNYAAVARALREGRGIDFGSSAFAVLSDLRMQTSLAKVPVTVAYVRELVDVGESVVVFTWSKEAAEQIVADVDGGVWTSEYLVTGDISQRERDSRVAEFQRSGGVLVATYATLSEGVTLTKARFVVNHDLDWTPATIEQSEKRMHRIGQEKPCVAAWVVLRDSIDEVFAKILQWKLYANSELLDNKNRQMTLDLVNVVNERSFEDEFQDVMEKWRAG